MPKSVEDDDRFQNVLLPRAGSWIRCAYIALAGERGKGGLLMMTILKAKIKKTWTLLEVIAHIGIIVTIVSMATGALG